MRRSDAEGKPKFGKKLTRARRRVVVTEAGEDVKESSLRPSKHAWPCQHFDFILLASRTVAGSISVILSNPV